MRISRHQMFMEIAHVVAKRATCFRENVGCIIVSKDNKIVSMGYNGPPPKKPHCKSHPNGQCSTSIHAERNAISYLEMLESQCDLYVTHLPCDNCVQYIIDSAMIKRVFFSTLYGDSWDTYKKLDTFNIQLLRVMPSGDITSHDRTEVYHDVQ